MAHASVGTFERSNAVISILAWRPIMKSPFIPLVVLLVFSISCSRQTERADVTENRSVAQQPVGQTKVAEPQQEVAKTERFGTQKVSLTEADKAESTAEAADRKIIRNADITMEVDSTTEAQHRVTSIAESHGGFVVTSEAKQRENIDPGKRTLDIKLVVRIPAEKFGVTLDEIKQLAGNLPEANVTGQDVTEDFIDLEARIKTQKALELQFLEIMKQARNVEDALEVQRQIAEVRTDVEKLEGRKRFLQNRSSLSTITVNIRAPKVIAVNPTGVGHSLREAVSDSLELASGLFIFFMRSAILLTPIILFVVLPSGLVLRYFVRRAKRAEALATPIAD